MKCPDFKEIDSVTYTLKPVGGIGISALAVGTLAIFSSSGFAARPVAFTSQEVFQGSSLKGWHSSGDAAWSASSGEITASAMKGPGLLLSDKHFQDTGAFTSFKCNGACDFGVVVRTVSTAEGTKGIYVSLKEGDLGSYRIAWDAQGKETAREKIRPIGGQIRLAPTPNATPNGGGGRGRGGRGPAPAN
jgi:hypothetical protein